MGVDAMMKASAQGAMPGVAPESPKGAGSVLAPHDDAFFRDVQAELSDKGFLVAKLMI